LRDDKFFCLPFFDVFDNAELHAELHWSSGMKIVFFHAFRFDSV